MSRSIIEKLKYRSPGFLYDLFCKKALTGISVVLHFNQSTTEYFDVAYEVCYGPLLKSIEKEDKIKFVLNFSRHFLLCMNRFKSDNRIIESLKRKENIIFADSMLNQGIMGILDTNSENTFFPERGSDYFWIPERCYDLSVIKSIEEHGYRYAFSERDDSEDASVDRFGNLFLLPEHPYSRYVIDSFLMFGKNRFEVKKLLCGGKDTIYAEDAEVVGLWNYERGLDHKVVHERFRVFLDEIKKNSCSTSLFPHELEFSEKINDIAKQEDRHHVSSWIEDSFNGKINQFFEPGFEDFSDFLRSGRIIRIKNKTSDLIEKISGLNVAYAIRRKLLELLYIYLFEFGCPGISKDGGYLWDGIYKVDKFIDLFRSKDDQIVKKDYIDGSHFLLRKGDTYLIIDEYAQLNSCFNMKNEVFIMDEHFHQLNSMVSEDRNCIALKNRLRLEFDHTKIHRYDNSLNLEFFKDNILFISFVLTGNGIVEIKKRQEYICDTTRLFDFLKFYDI